MESFIPYYSVILIAITLAVLARDSIRRTWDLFSWRTVFLLGLIHFYFIGAYFTAGGKTRGAGLAAINPDTWLPLAFAMALFLGLFLAAAWAGFRSPRLTALVPSLALPLTAPALLGSIVVLCAASIFCCIPMGSYVGLFASQFRGQFVTAAVGLATYYVIARRFNPASWGALLGTMAVGLLASTVASSGRRMLLSVLLAVPWMWYFTVWRYRAAQTNFARLGVMAAIAVLAIVAYSPFRARDTGRDNQDATAGRRAGQFVEMVTTPLNPKMLDHILYTDTVSNTLWTIDNFPGMVRYDPFQGFKWLVTNPIPRSVWQDKPVALGTTMAVAQHREKNFSYGPGIIAHGWSEGWYFGVAGYALFFGLLMGIADRALAMRAVNPFFVATLGCNLGNIFALARGDTPLFLIQILAGVIGCTVVLALLGATYGRVWAVFPEVTPRDSLTAPPESPEGESAGQEGADPAIEPDPAAAW
jgi:hypothetical protein